MMCLKVNLATMPTYSFTFIKIHHPSKQAYSSVEWHYIYMISIHALQDFCGFYCRF